MTPAYEYLSNFEYQLPLADDTAMRSQYNATVDRTDPRLRELLNAEPAVSLHDHPFRYPEPFTYDTWAQSRMSRRMLLGYEGLAQSGMGAIVACTHSYNTAEEVVSILASLNTDLHHQERFYLADSGETIRRRFFGGDIGKRPVGVVLGLESLTAFADELDNVELLYALGVRVGGLIYSEGSILGAGLSSANDEGLTSQGKAFIRRMNDVGMVVDLAHVGDRTSLDAISASTAPVTISHAGAREVWPTSRMKPDAVVRALADNGGVIGVEAAPNTTNSSKRTRHDIHAVMDHVEYLVDLVGIDHVSFGPDTIFGEHASMHAIRSVAHAPSVKTTEVEHVDFVDGVENPNEAFWNMTAWLMEHGYSDEDIVKLTSRNAMRIIDNVTN